MFSQSDQEYLTALLDGAGISENPIEFNMIQMFRSFNQQAVKLEQELMQKNEQLKTLKGEVIGIAKCLIAFRQAQK